MGLTRGKLGHFVRICDKSRGIHFGLDSFWRGIQNFMLQMNFFDESSLICLGLTKDKFLFGYETNSYIFRHLIILRLPCITHFMFVITEMQFYVHML